MSATPFYLAGEARTSDDIREICSPWDGRVVARVCWANGSLLTEAIDKAYAARPLMAELSAHQRASILERVRSLVSESIHELALEITHEAGKPIRTATAEVARALDTLTDAAFAARQAMGQLEPVDAYGPGEGRVALCTRVPKGVVSAITPFNFPFNLVMHKVAAAVAAGCPIVVKPAPETPSSALSIARMFQQAGLPEGALSVLPLDVDQADALTQDCRLAILSFTGSGAVGWRLKARAVHMNALLELGGNAGNLVCADADLDHAAARLVAGAFGYAGQSCISVQRVFVEASVHDALLEKIVARTQALGCGNPMQADTVVGPLIRSRDADRVMAAITSAVEAGGVVHTGGTREGQVVHPTVLTGVPREAAVVATEIFGPVLVLEAVDTFEDGLTAIDASPYGLQAGLFTDSVSRVLQAQRDLEVGAIVHDDCSTFRVDGMPYGGVKGSGIGREGPRHLVWELTEPRLVILRR